jgi:hypothetical protein
MALQDRPLGKYKKKKKKKKINVHIHKIQTKNGFLKILPLK